jgi:S1-C subfamily serine protease
VDTDPRPTALAPTREQSVIPAPTREADTVRPPTVAQATSSPPQKVGVGKETFESTVVKLKSEGRRSAITVAAIGAVIVVVVAAVLLYQNSQTKKELGKTTASLSSQLSQTNSALGEAQNKLANADLSAAEIKGKIGKAIVYLESTFGLADASDKPVMTTSYRDENGNDLFVFMKTQDPKYPYVPLLLTDVSQLPSKATGQPLVSGASGSGFAVSGNGFILTNRHVVNPWVVPLTWPVRGVAFDPATGGLFVDASTHKILVQDYGEGLTQAGWNPTQWQGYQSPAKVRFLKTVLDLPQVKGHILSLQVTLSGNSNPYNATVSRVSDDADVALVQVASPEALSTVEMNDNYETADVGKVWVLGFPGAAVPSFVVKQSQAKYFGEDTTAHLLADPDTAAGQLTRVIRPKNEKGTKPMGKIVVNPAYGDVYELSVPGVGHGNSGGPVTDAQGKVIGILTLGLDQPITLQYAVPIRYGKELISNSG